MPEGEKLLPALTFTCRLAETRPEPEAEILEIPRPTPVICAGESGVDWPALKVSVEGEIVRLDGLLDTRFTVTPPAGAGRDSETAKGTVWPTPIEGAAGSTMAPRFATVTGRVV